mmetsp:Transcript_27442/g.31406  ORF Transcript_27442/g.31406 Transcript_27442/m.31406 type:complete len:90 (-) Transcript_27442:756-1025(-)
MSLLLSCEDLEEIYNERVEHVYSLLKSTATEVYKKKSKECEAKKIITTKEEDEERLTADVKRLTVSSSEPLMVPTACFLKEVHNRIIYI